MARERSALETPALFVVVVSLAAPGLGAQVRAGGEFLVNTHTTDNQYAPAAASDRAGRFVVAWNSHGQDGDDGGIHAQRFDAAGVSQGAEFRVNTHTSGLQIGPAVAVSPNGEFVIVWQSEGQDGSATGIFGQRYERSGAPAGAEFPVNTYTTGAQQVASVGMDGGGGFVVAWTSDGQDGSDGGIFARRYQPWGEPRGPEFLVNSVTAGRQDAPRVAVAPSGEFVMVWASPHDGSGEGVFGQLYDASGAPRGAEFRVNTWTSLSQNAPGVTFASPGEFVATWASDGQDGDGQGIFAQRFDALAVPLGPELLVNSTTSLTQVFPAVAADAAGNFVIAWASWHLLQRDEIFAQRFDATGNRRGAEFLVNSYTTSWQATAAMAADAAGNFTVTWRSRGPDGGFDAVMAQRFGGIVPIALDVDASATGGSDGNGVLEPGESVDLRPSWLNVNGVAQSFDATATSFSGPTGGGVSYQLLDGIGSYGTAPNNTVVACTDCYRAGVTVHGPRPASHWDAVFTERLTPDALGQTMPWALHVGESFPDVPKASPFYRFVETLLHRGVTAGCGGGLYCAAAPTTREQMAAFVLLAKEGNLYVPPPCRPPNQFADVPEVSPYCDVIEELARRGVVAGCGGGNYCPGAAVAREQMAVFVLRTLDPALVPPACTTPLFADVPASSPFCPWIEELARRGVVGGCGGGHYCPTDGVTREQMAVFLAGTFGLTLYGP